MTDLEKLCSRVTEAADCAVITDDVNRRYFTAMKSSAGTLLVFPEKAYFIIDFRYIENDDEWTDEGESGSDRIGGTAAAHR